MRPSEIRKIKDPYRFWYEFLKRSKKYKKFCAAKQAGNNLKLTNKNAKLWDVYDSWGDVFQNPFRESYRKFKSKRSPITRQAVVDYKAEFRKQTADIIEKFERENDREITSRELLDRMEGDFGWQTIVLKIDPTRGPDEAIMAKVKKALEEKRSEHSTKGRQLLECVNCRPTTDNPKIEYFKICLIVYDLRQSGMTYREAIRASGRTEHGNFIHSFRRYYAAAEELIKNAEQGLFPGDYQPDPEEPYEYRVFVDQAP